MAANRTFEARIRVNRDGHRLLPPCNRPQEAVQPEHGADLIVGQERNRGERLNANYPSHIYFHPDDDTTVELRVGPMLYAQNIVKAFDYFSEGLRFAAQLCTYPPYPTLADQELEVIFTCATIAARGVLGDQMVGENAMTHICGNAFVVGLPDTALYPAADANRFVLTGVRATIRMLDDTMRENITERMGEQPWNTPNTADTTPAEAINDIVQILAVNMTTATRQMMMSCYLGIFLAYTQQGNMTTRKLNKIQNELQQINLVTTLTTDTVRSLWNTFGAYFDDTAASQFFPYWERAFTGRVLRMQLLMQQVANAGLTSLTLIRTAISIYPDFRWDKLAAKCPQDWNNFLQAHNTVGTNIYYGFKKDLGIVGVRNYKAIAYCAKVLHRRAMGDGNMEALQTLTNLQVPESAYIDAMVQEFVNHKQRALVVGDRAAAAAYFDGPEPPNFLAQPDAPRAGLADMDALRHILENIGLQHNE